MNNHLLKTATQKPSPNFSQRPDNEISLIVLHNIALPPRQFDNDYVEQFFTNKLDFNAHPYFQSLKKMQVSAHLLIKRNGAIIQFVPFDKCAWHAGKSHFKGRGNCNDFSIGIELCGTDDIAYEAQQYKSLKQALKTLKHHYNITDVVGHSDIAPGRKTDPGQAFEWSKIF